MFIRRTDSPVLSRQLYGVRPDVDVKVFRREKFACFQTMIIRLEEETFVHSCTRALVHSMAAVTCQEAVSGHVTEENAGKTILPEILNIFETKKYLKNEPDRGTM